MNSKETLEFVIKLIDSTEAQITYLKNKIVEDEQYPPLQDMHKEELITSQEYLTHLYQIKQDLDKLEKLEKVIEILVNKTIHFMFLKRTLNVENYNKHSDTYNYDKLTQEEYDLLKEVLGNEQKEKENI